MKISLMGLGDLVPDPVTGKLETHAQKHRAFVEAAVVADEAGFHGVHVGEHHGQDYIYSSPPVMLSAIGERTKRVRLSTAVTLAANLDPIRLAEDYATVDALHDGRCEVVVGRGNFFVTTYQLFGQTIDDSHDLFETNVDIIRELWADKPVTTESRFRAPIGDFTLQPPPTSDMPIWVGGGASQSTADFAASRGLPLMLPSAFGNPMKFMPIIEKYREAYESYGHDHPAQVGACWHVNVSHDGAQAKERWETRYKAYFDLMNRMILKVTPNPPEFVHKPFDYERMLTKGPAIVGSPAEVTDRLGSMAELLGADVNLLSLDMGGQPTGEFLQMVELLGSAVIPQLN